MKKQHGDIRKNIAAKQEYNNSDRYEALITANQNIAKSTAAGLFGGSDVIQPNWEFGSSYFLGGGGFGGLGGMGIGPSQYGDLNTNPFRFTLGYGGLGFMGSEGWAFRRAHVNINHLRIAQCLMMYHTEGYVQTLVHLLADFASEGINIKHTDLSVQNFFRAWAAKIGLRDRMHRFVIDLITAGNVFIWRKEAKLKSEDEKILKKGIAAKKVGDSLLITVGEGHKVKEHLIDIDTSNCLFPELEEAARKMAEAGRVTQLVTKVIGGTDASEPDVSSKKMPWGYDSLNPLQMDIRGSKFAGDSHWVMKLHRDDLKPLAGKMNYTYFTDLGKTVVNLPEEFKSKLRKLEAADGDYIAEIDLDPERLTVIQDVTKKDYEDWATPSIYPAYKEVMFKRMLRAGEASAMESLKHMITLIKLGNVKENLIPSKEQIGRVAAALAGGSQSHYLVWDDLIDGQVLQPNVDKIFDPKKYESIDKDIYMSLGIPASVMTGQGSYSNSFLAIKLLLQKLETIRNKFVGWLFKEIKVIVAKMKFRKLPLIEFGRMNLTDENAERNLIINLFDRGILSKETALEYFDTNFDIEKARQENERQQTSNDLTLMKPRGPFIKEGIADVAHMDEHALTGKKPSEFVDDQFKKQQKLKAPKNNGRPPFSGKKQTTKRRTKPKGMGELIKYEATKAYAMIAYDKISTIITNDAVNKANVKDVRSLDKETKAAIDNLTNVVLSMVKPYENITSELVYKIVAGIYEEQSPYFTNGQIRPSINRLYASELKPELIKDQRKELICTAYAYSFFEESVEE